MEKEMKELKLNMKKNLPKERAQNKRELEKFKVKFPTHTTRVYHSTRTFIQPSAVLMSSDSLPKFTSLLTYFLHFRSNNFNYFASKLPKAALSQEIRARLEFSDFQK
jgi:hypothetical protein